MEVFKALIVSPTPELLAFVNSFNKLAKDTRELWKLHKAQLGIWTEEGGWEDEEPKAETPAA